MLDLDHLISDLESLRAALAPRAQVGVRVASGAIDRIIGVGIHQGEAYMVLKGDPPSAVDKKGQKDPVVDAKKLPKRKKG